MKTTQTSKERWYTPPMAAKELGVSEEEIIAFIRTGELRASNLAAKANGRPRYVINPSDLAAFLEARCAFPHATEAIA